MANEEIKEIDKFATEKLLSGMTETETTAPQAMVFIEHKAFSGTTTLTFTSSEIIKYEYLKLIVDASASAGYILIRFNYDSGANYQYKEHNLAGNTSSSTGEVGIDIGNNGNVQGEFLIFRRARNSEHSVCGVMLGDGANLGYLAGGWGSGNDITSISLVPESANTTGQATLYGIKTS